LLQDSYYKPFIHDNSVTFGAAVSKIRSSNTAINGDISIPHSMLGVLVRVEPSNDSKEKTQYMLRHVRWYMAVPKGGASPLLLSRACIRADTKETRELKLAKSKLAALRGIEAR